MKKILVPTDFSPAAETAARYGALLAKEAGASLLLLNVYQVPITMGDMPVMMVSVEELKQNADKALTEAKRMVEAYSPGIEVQVESRLGDLEDEVNDIAGLHDTLAVVVGSKGYRGLEKFLFGNTALSLIRNCRVPVISVPADVKISAPKNLVLATDLQNTAEVPAGKIVELAQLLGAKLHIVHVKESNEEPVGEQQLLQSMQALDPVFHRVKDDDVIHGLQQYVEITLTC